MTRPIALLVSLMALAPVAALVACGSDSSSSASGDGGGLSDAPADVTTLLDSSGQDASVDGTGPGTDAPADASTDTGASDGPFVMAPHPALPRMIHYGPPDAGVLTAPKIVTVTFAGDPFATQIEELDKGFASSSFWNTVRPGFCDSKSGPCIGDGPPGVSVRLGAEPPTDAGTLNMNTFPNWLTTALANHELPAPDSASPSETIYVVVFQQGYKFQGLCSGFLGYHGVAKYGPSKQEVTFAVVGECKAGAGMTSLELTTQTVNHEILEAATDPREGFYLDLRDPASYPWNNLFGGEVGDLCDWYGPAPNHVYWPGENVTYPTPDAGTLSLQRIWSPVQAAKGADPCLPVPPGVVFFGVAPAQPVIVLDVGGSATIDGYAFSTAPVGDFNIEFGGNTKYVSLSMSGVPSADGGQDAIVNNGDVIKIKITLLKDPGSVFGNNGVANIHAWTGSRDAPTAAYEWPFMVMTPADATDGGFDAGITVRPEDHMPIPRPLPMTRPEALQSHE